jgi:predicted Zn-dependent protease
MAYSYKIRLSISLVALSMVACMPEYERIEYPLDFWIDEDVSPELYNSTLNAVDRWNELSREKLGYDILIFQGNTQVNFKSALRNSRFDIVELTEEEDADFRKDYPYGLGACFTSHGKEARVDVVVSKPEMIHRWANGHDLTIAYDVLALHELGHALGLPHTSDRNDIMYYEGEPLERFTTITPWAEEEFCHIHGCADE